MMPQMTMSFTAVEKSPMNRAMKAQGTMTVPAPMMGIKSITARPRASSRP